MKNIFYRTCAEENIWIKNKMKLLVDLELVILQEEWIKYHMHKEGPMICPNQ